ncbi:hypothetical protein Taro_024185 [Colocasia esculenta]|uniref:RNase H type-1 domain-containing protein n=1 Tax=Colocasia esculenta TaxID=4460 RepID=A0A843V5R2_COLES|nr:hypothetical protein [Colocasia esculenta]
MATLALDKPTEGALTGRRSYAQIISASKPPPPVLIGVKALSFTDAGEPAVFFSKDEVKLSINTLKLDVIVRCAYGRSSIPEIKSALSQRLQLKGNSFAPLQGNLEESVLTDDGVPPQDNLQIPLEISKESTDLPNQPGQQALIAPVTNHIQEEKNGDRIMNECLAMSGIPHPTEKPKQVQTALVSDTDTSHGLHGDFTLHGMNDVDHLAIILKDHSMADDDGVVKPPRIVPGEEEVGGDFNCVLAPSEKKGGNPPRLQAMVDFNACMSASSLLDAGYSGSPFTWSNNHYPSVKRALKSCTFSSNVGHSNPWVNLDLKLKAVKGALRLWNKTIFGNIHDNLAMQDHEVTIRQQEFDRNPTSENRSELGAANANLRKAMKCVEAILDGVVLTEDSDKCMWVASPNGSFTTRSTYNLTCPTGVYRAALSKIWHRRFNRRASLFSWKVLNRAVPVDGHVADIGIPMASCCSSKRFEDPILSPEAIISNVKNNIGHSFSKITFKVAPSIDEWKTLLSFGFAPQCSSKMLKLIRWIPPLHDFSLNVDGACKGNPGDCGGGGCIRDSMGNVHLAFSHFYGTGTSMQAEIRALTDGLRLASVIGYKISIVYTDSQVIAHSIKDDRVVVVLGIATDRGVAFWKRRVPCCLLVEKTTTLVSRSQCLLAGVPRVRSIGDEVGIAFWLRMRQASCRDLSSEALNLLGGPWDGPNAWFGLLSEVAIVSDRGRGWLVSKLVRVRSHQLGTRIHAAFFLRVATGSSSPSGLGRYVAFRSEADTLVPFWGFPEGVPCVLVPTELVMVTSQLCRFLWWLPRQFSFARCSALEGLSVLFRCRPVSPSHSLTLRWFWSHVGRSGMGPQFGQTAVVLVVVA